MSKENPYAYRAGNYEKFCEYEDSLPPSPLSFYDEQDLNLQAWLEGEDFDDCDGWDFYDEIDEDYGDEDEVYYNARNPKLTPEDVEELRRMYAEEDYSPPELADIFDISSRHVYYIINRERWF